MKQNQHFDAKSVSEAISLLGKFAGKARIIAGGTDLYGELKDAVHPESPEALVNLKTIPGLAYIKEDAEGLKIGALTTLTDIETNSIIKEKYAALSQAARNVGSKVHRNMGTIGGNLCQHARCWYYRYSKNKFFCFRKGGPLCYAVAGDNRYHAIMGGEVCFAVCPSDMAPALIALGGKVKVASAAGERVAPLEEFYTVLGTVLKPDEIVTEIQVPTPAAGTRQTFLKFRLRKAIDFAIASVAAAITIEGGVCKAAKIALGGVAPKPIRATKAEDAIKGKTIDDAAAASAASAAVEGAMPLSMNAYKVQITKALVRQAILGKTS